MCAWSLLHLGEVLTLTINQLLLYLWCILWVVYLMLSYEVTHEWIVVTEEILQLIRLLLLSRLISSLDLGCLFHINFYLLLVKLIQLVKFALPL